MALSDAPHRSARDAALLVELQLGGEIARGPQRPRSVSVRLEPPAGVDEGTAPGQLETRTAAVGGGASPIINFDSSHVINLERDSRAWAALSRALDGLMWRPRRRDVMSCHESSPIFM